MRLFWPIQSLVWTEVFQIFLLLAKIGRHFAHLALEENAPHNLKFHLVCNNARKLKFIGSGAE